MIRWLAVFTSLLFLASCQSSSPKKQSPLIAVPVAREATTTTSTTLSPLNEKAKTPVLLIEDQLKNIRFSTGIPGLAVLKVDPLQKDILLFDGFRKWGSADFVQLNDSWHLGTNTQAMTSYILAQLHQQGMIDLEKPVSKYVNLKMNSDHKSLRVIDLLRHQSRLRSAQAVDHGQLWKQLWSSTQTAQQLRGVITVRILQSEGSHPKAPFNFNHVNYVIAANLAEKISGKSWELLIHKYVFSPLKMKTCGFGAAGDPRLKYADQPWPHFENQNKIQFVKPSPEADNPPALRPSVGVYCSLQDWSKFVETLQKEYRGEGLLSAAILKMMFEISGESRFVAAGWSRSQNDWSSGPVFSHDGTNGLNFTSAVWAPETKKRILFATNIGGDRGGRAAIEVLRVLMNH